MSDKILAAMDDFLTFNALRVRIPDCAPKTKMTYAPLRDTLRVLDEAGFNLHGLDLADGLDPITKAAHAEWDVFAHVYLAGSGYYCVSLRTSRDVSLGVEGEWQAPVVWFGPRAEWDKTDESADFKRFLKDFYS